MCGIAGIVGPVSSAAREAVDRMTAALVHRGPDGSGTWSTPSPDGSMGAVFGHRRLAIIDTGAGGAQPMVDRETGCALVFNGEIYNFREVRAQLQAQGLRFSSNSDTEVILQGWNVWGPECIPRLRGMFALALWDPRTRCVYLCRDRLGIKPLYTSQSSMVQGAKVLVFGSEVRSLLASGLVERRLDPASLAAYAWSGFTSGAHSVVAGIKALAPGTMLRVSVDSGQCTSTPYWTLEHRDLQQRRPREAHEVIREAVRQHLVSDVPLGVFVSGGVDSTAISVLAAQASSSALRTFNVRFEQPTLDESPYAREVSRALGAEHTELCLTKVDFQQQLEGALDSLDQPTFDGINTYFVSRAVREAGVTVALAGTGGDELFGGYQSFLQIPRIRGGNRWLQWAPAAVPRLLGRMAAGLNSLNGSALPPQSRWGKLADFLAAGTDLTALYQTAYALFSSDIHGQLTRDCGAADLAWGLDPNEFAQRAESTRGWTPRAALSLLEIQSFLQDRLLPDTDCASMGVSLEVRVPLLDHVVVEAAFGLPDQDRFLPLGRKQILRDLVPVDLAAKVLNRPKSGFVLPIDAWCRDAIRSEVAAVLNDSGACRSAGLRPEVVSRLWQAFDSGGRGIYWSRIWSLFVLLRWCHRHAAAL